jgi:hypothetical protein
MNHAAEIVSQILGVALVALGIGALVRILNRPQKRFVVAALGAVCACLWGPFSWLVLMAEPWDEYRTAWFHMGVFLPGLLPGALLFHARGDLLEFSTMALTTLCLLIGLGWLATRNWTGFAVACFLALAVSIPTSYLAYGLYRF